MIIYRDDKSLLQPPGDNEVFYSEEESMDFELIEKNEIALLSKDLLFSTRVFILKKQWGSLLTLPFKLPVSSKESQLISFYLKTEIDLREAGENKNDNDDSILQLKKINRLYQALCSLLSMNMDKVDKYFVQNFMDTDLIYQVTRVINLKKDHLNYEIKKSVEEHFFYDTVLLKLKKRILKIEEFASK